MENPEESVKVLESNTRILEYKQKLMDLFINNDDITSEEAIAAMSDMISLIAKSMIKWEIKTKK